MGVMARSHPGVRMPELLGKSRKRTFGHEVVTGVGMTQDVERDFRAKAGRLAGGLDSPGLLGSAPRLAIGLQKEPFSFGPSCGKLGEEPCSVLIEKDVARFAALALADVDSSLVSHVSNLKSYQLPIAASTDEGSLDQSPEVRLAGVQQFSCLFYFQVGHPWGIHSFEPLH